MAMSLGGGSSEGSRPLGPAMPNALAADGLRPAAGAGDDADDAGAGGGEGTVAGGGPMPNWNAGGAGEADAAAATLSTPKRMGV